MKWCGKLILGKYRFEVVQVYVGIATILLFWIDVWISSESIWLFFETAQVEINNEIELKQIFKSASLPVCENLGSKKVGEVLVVSDNVHQKVWALQVVSPNLECLEDCKEFFIINVIVEFWSEKDIEVESNKIEFCRIDRKYSSERIVRSISLDNNLSIWYQYASISADVNASLRAANVCLHDSKKFHKALLHVKHVGIWSCKLRTL